MCFQGFAHCSCGHTVIFETKCELAEDHPFYIKVACSNYRIESRILGKACGIGGFYCKQTKDGPFLDSVHQKHVIAQKKLAFINTRLEKVNAAQATFQRSADEHGISMELRAKHHAFHRLNASQQQLLQGRGIAEQVCRRFSVTIQEAKNFYARQAQRVLAGYEQDLQPSFIDAAKAQHAMVTAQTIDVSERGLPDQAHFHGLAQQLGPRDNDASLAPYAGFSHIRSLGSGLPAAGNHLEPKIAGTASVPINQGRQRRILHETVLQPSRSRRSASPKKPVLQQQSSNVRRSARVRDKKVSYAESDVSSIPSREHSPEKSDISGFSPSKSDLTDSPDKYDRSIRGESIEIRRESSELNDSKLRRSSSSLCNRIGDWKQRNKSAISTPKFTTMPANATAKPPALSDLLRNAQAPGPQFQQVTNSNLDARPPTRHGIPLPQTFGRQASNMALPPALPNFLPEVPAQNTNLNLFNTYAQGSRATENTSHPYFHREQQPNAMPAQMDVNRSWLINTPAFNFLSSFTGDPSNTEMADGGSNNNVPMERNDSLIGSTTLEGSNNKPDQIPASLNYDYMRRSFTIPADLTPPVFNGEASMSTDPKKRKLPASSPLESPSKRMRLSLPGASSVYDESLPYDAVSAKASPEKMRSQMPPGIDEGGRLQVVAGTEDPPTLAPILAPTAVMYAPLQQDWYTEEDAGPVNTELPEQYSASAPIADDVGNQFSDINWEDLINDDVV